MRSRLFLKVYVGYVIVILITVATIGWLLAGRIRLELRQETERSLRTTARLLAELVRSPSRVTGESLSDAVQRLGNAEDLRLTVIGADGSVLADSDADPEGLDDHRRRPEIVAARDEGEGLSVRWSDTLGRNQSYLAVRVDSSDGEILAYARVSIAVATLEERLAGLVNPVILGTVVAAVIAFAVGFVVTRRIVAPIEVMTDTAEALSRGEYGRRASVTSFDEIGLLARSFNAMAQQLEERLEATTGDRNKLSTILAGMVEGVVAMDLEGRIVHINHVASSLLGSSSVDSVGRPVREVVKTADISEILLRTIEHGREVEGETRLGRSRQIIEMRASPLHDGREQLIGAVVVLHNITELRRLEAIRRDFVANVSHELKTPITAIRGLAETLVGDSEMPAETRDRFLRKINKQANRMATLATDLLTLARLESRGGVLELQELDLRTCVLGAIRSLAPLEDDLDVQLHVELGEASLLVRGDEQALRMVVTNLLDNALKYTPAGGEIWVRLTEVHGDAVLEVQDTGIGVPQQDVHRIFERFYRVDKARSREVGGTGLGLSIVKHICLAHDGEVSVESDLENGSTFRVRLPVVGSR